jgi:hypothetical protein
LVEGGAVFDARQGNIISCYHHVHNSCGAHQTLIYILEG